MSQYVHVLDTIFMLKEKIQKVTGVRRATQIWHSKIQSNGGDFGDGNPLNDEDMVLRRCGLGQGGDIIYTLSASDQHSALCRLEKECPILFAQPLSQWPGVAVSMGNVVELDHVHELRNYTEDPKEARPT